MKMYTSRFIGNVANASNVPDPLVQIVSARKDYSFG